MKNVLVTVKMPPMMVGILNKIAEEKGVSRSEIIRLAVEKYVEEYLKLKSTASSYAGEGLEIGKVEARLIA